MKRLIFLFFVSILLSSCSETVPYATPTKVNAYQTPFVSQLPTPEKTQTDSIATNELITNIPSTPKNEVCVEYVENSRLAGEGSLVLVSLSQGVGDKFEGAGMIVDMKSFESTIVKLPTWFPDVSPKGNALAYLDYRGLRVSLIVLTKGKVYKFPNEKFTYFYWINENTIAIKEDYEPDSHTLFIDPFQNKITKLDTDFPEMIGSAKELINPWMGKVTSFNASLNYAVYPSGTGINLLDLQNDSIIRRLNSPQKNYPPLWSPMGNGFLVLYPVDNKFELTEIMLDGTVEVLTDLHSYYSDYFIEAYSWSPDGKEIAFWYAVGDGYPEVKKLAFINLSDGSITFTCITSKNMVSAFRDYLIWSQDNSKLAVNIYSEKGSSVALIDNLSKSYRIISSGYDLTLMGWLNFKPEIN